MTLVTAVFRPTQNLEQLHQVYYDVLLLFNQMSWFIKSVFSLSVTEALLCQIVSWHYFCQLISYKYIFFQLLMLHENIFTKDIRAGFLWQTGTEQSLDKMCWYLFVFLLVHFFWRGALHWLIYGELPYFVCYGIEWLNKIIGESSFQ